MAGLALILEGISTFDTGQEFEAVMNAVEVRKMEVSGNRKLNDNSIEAIAKNENLFDYSQVPDKLMEEAKTWFGALKPVAARDIPESKSDYFYWHKWNKPAYKGYNKWFELVFARVDSEVEDDETKRHKAMSA